MSLIQNTIYQEQQKELNEENNNMKYQQTWKTQINKAKDKLVENLFEIGLLIVVVTLFGIALNNYINLYW